jgi:hypothetical protein
VAKLDGTAAATVTGVKAVTVIRVREAEGGEPWAFSAFISFVLGRIK